MVAETNPTNTFTLTFSARRENVAAVRLLVASVASQSHFTLSEVEELKVAVSEGVSNAIIHGYQNDHRARVTLEVALDETALTLRINDEGCGIADVAKAMEPTFSTVAERMGLGFVFMQSFMDEFSIDTAPQKGTLLTMKKYVHRCKGGNE